MKEFFFISGLPRSLLISLRTSSALKWTQESSLASAVARVVLPAPGKPMIRIFI